MVWTVPPGEAKAGGGAPWTMPWDGHACCHLRGRGSPDGHWGQSRQTRDGCSNRRPARTAAGVCSFRGVAGRGGTAASIIAPHGWPRGYVTSDKGRGAAVAGRRRQPSPRKDDCGGMSPRRSGPAWMAVGVCRLGGAAGRGSGGLCRGRGTAAEISTRSRPSDRGDRPTEKADGRGRRASGQEKDGGRTGGWRR